MRKGEQDHIMTTGKLVGRRSQGRPIMKILNGLARRFNWKRSPEQLIEATQDRFMKNYDCQSQ